MFKNIAGYQFVSLDNLPELKALLLTYAQQQGIKGTILLSSEGINIMLAGSPEAIANFEVYLSELKIFAPFNFKYSESPTQPYGKILVKIKQEIITMKQPEVNPAENPAPELEPELLKLWLDEQRDLVLIDTRNNYEHKIGSFTAAMKLDIEHFSQFPAVIAELDENIKQKTVVVFCTGGIRCEKAAPYMLQQGFKEVYQLKGGILKYFEACQGEHYDGDCFVFDDRVAVNAELQPTGAVICKICHEVVENKEAHLNQCYFQDSTLDQMTMNKV